MFNNNLKIALRRLKNEKLFTVLNITGLTVGIASFILLFVYVRHELSYDQFHSQVDKIHALGWEYPTADGIRRSESASLKGARLMKERVPEIKYLTQVNLFNDGTLVSIGEVDYYENEILMADGNFFKVFDFEVLEGVPQLDDPYKAAITETIAQKYFADQHPIGQTIDIDGEGEFLITAIVKDAPVNSHIQFNIITSGVEYIKKQMSRGPEEYQWYNIAVNYVLLNDGADASKVDAKLRDVAVAGFPENMLKTDENGEKTFGLYMVPFGDIHLKSGFDRALTPVGSMLYVYVFASIGILILLIACFNYINLVTAHSMKKAKEIGLRKVVGARRKEIIGQQMAEAGLFTFLSVLLAFGMAERSLPYFNRMIGTEIGLSYLSLDFLVFVFGLSTLVAVIAGYYPAIKLSGFSPIQGLRGTGAPKGKSGLRRGLVLFQFFIAQALIICTFIIQSQLSYLQNKSLGYDKDHTLYIETYDELKGRGEAFKAELQTIPGVTSVSMSESKFEWMAVIFMDLKDIEGFEEEEPGQNFIPNLFTVDRSFLKTMGMTMVAGKAFHELEDGVKTGLIVNEVVLKTLGWSPEEALGKTIPVWGKKKRVVGVVKNFFDETLKNELKPSILNLNDKTEAFANININSADMRTTMNAIEAKWDSFVTERPLTYRFYDDDFNMHYEKEARLGGLFNVFSIIAISISILGLIGLTTFSAQQRLKEFSVRKVLGARVLQLIGLLSREFLWLLVIAFTMAVPLTYYYMKDWLTEFTYRIDIGIVVYLLSILATLCVCMLAVSIQSFKVARFNPAEVLRRD